MAKLNLMALDLGASNGRGIVGRFDGSKITLEEVHRFANEYVELNGTYYWDIMKLYMELKTCFSNYTHKYGDTLGGFGIDTWGVDYALFDKRGQLLGNAISYRNTVMEQMQTAWKTVPKREIFNRTGLASQCFNTLFQLHTRALNQDIALQNADKLLFMPDALAYFLTGDMGSEYTIASTSMMVNPKTKRWDEALLAQLGIDKRILTAITPSCTLRGKMLQGVADELGMSRIPFAAIGEHDTASAVAAVPADGGNYAFLSSGTWSLFGVERDTPVLSDEVFDANYTNEGTIQGGIRVLKNIMGLWLIQECRRDWLKRGEQISWDDIVNQAKTAAPLQSIIDPEYEDFFNAGGMEHKIQTYCKRTGQTVPQSKGEIARCIYESLALKYRWAVERLEVICDKKIDTLNIVGGGIQNKLLNQMAADATGLRVVTGPVEGACIGNLLGTAMALGEIADLSQLREVVRRSFDVEEYVPQPSQAWEDAYGKLLALM